MDKERTSSNIDAGRLISRFSTVLADVDKGTIIMGNEGQNQVLAMVAVKLPPGVNYDEAMRFLIKEVSRIEAALASGKFPQRKSLDSTPSDPNLQQL